MAAVLLILLAAWWLRVVGLDGMHLTGDAAYSVHVAGASLAEITLGRVSDGHPPLYYWLLHATIGLFGATEYAARLPTAMTGLLAIPFAWRAARGLAPSALVTLSAARDPSPSSSVPPLAAALVAFSPLLVFYSRDPRMYALLPLAAIASTVLLERGRWAGYAAAALVGLWSHYYMLPLVAGQALWLFLFRRAALRSAVPTFAVVGLGFAPWLLFALVSQATATAGVISNAEPPHGPLGFVESLWTPFHAGAGLDYRIGAALGLLAALAWLLALRRRAPAPPLLRLIAVSSAVALALALALFAVAPYAVRPRFWTGLLPGYLVAAAWALSRLRRRWLIGALAALVVVHAAALDGGHRVGQLTVEREAPLLGSALEHLGEPGDALLIEARWLLGYLRAHYAGPHFVERTPEQLDGHQRAWLAVYRGGKHHHPWEVWLDDNWGRAAVFDHVGAHLNLYARPPPIDRRLEVAFAPDAPSLVAVGLPPSQVRPGDVLPVALRWRAPPTGQAPRRVTPFLHVLDRQDQRRFGADDEPRNGYYPTHVWSPGQEVDDARALLVPDDLTPGRYRLALGMYPTGGGERLGQLVTLAEVEVVARVRPRVAHAADLPLAPGVRLTGWSSELDQPSFVERGEVRWTTVDRWPLHARRDWLTRGQDAAFALRVAFDAPPTSPVGIDVGGRRVEVEPSPFAGERLIRFHLPMPDRDAWALEVNGQELARFRLD
jgi:mannosyltransferase